MGKVTFNFNTPSLISEGLAGISSSIVTVSYVSLLVQGMSYHHGISSMSMRLT